jgi:hypothetical protein
MPNDQIDIGKVAWDPAIDASKVAWDDERSRGDEVLRQLGLTARAGVKGFVALPGTVADAASGIVNEGLDLARGKGNGFRFQTTRQALDNVMTGAGLPKAQNATERMVQDVVGGGFGAGGSVATGRVLQSASAPMVQQAGRLLATGPGMQTLSGVTGSGAMGVTREGGGGPVAQAAVGVLGAAAPSAGLAGATEGVKRVWRGGEAGRQRVAENIELFRNAANTHPSVGQATEARFPRAVESLLSKSPGGAGVMTRAAEHQTAAFGQRVNQIADDLAPGASSIKAGESITGGVEGFKEGFKKLQDRLYDKLDQHIPAQAPVPVGNTEFALKQLNEGIEGAPNLSQFFRNSKLVGIDRALQADLERSVNGGTLPYEAVKKLRTLVGREIADNSLVSDVPRSQYRALYGALSEDLGRAASSAGPQAQHAWQWANTYSRTQLERLDQLSGIVGKDAPEKVFQAAMSGSAEGDTILRRVVDAIPKDNRKEVAAAVLRRMGRATAGNQNDVGNVFSTETFLTNLNRLSPEAKRTLFDRLGVPSVMKGLRDLSGAATNIREGSKVFSNPSGSGQVIGAQTPAWAAGALLLSGHPAAAGATAAAPLATNALARHLTSPQTVDALARPTSISPAIAPAEINMLTRIFSGR